MVKIGENWGYIDKTGEMVVNPQFDSDEKFCQGLAEVTIGSKTGYINKAGKYVWNPTD
ncbi:MAG: hypothetical protein BRC44_16035 [Cyanobacteria bacterium QS_4_48_99]|nr:MAG: hypothetical protein BRC44_16035 [Cyanobacteria bacterium QS_4_48_99]